jgi:hypothetical protein
MPRAETFSCKTGAAWRPSFFAPRQNEVRKNLVLQAGRKNCLAFSENWKVVESAVDFGFVAAFGMIFETDTDYLAVRGQGLEGETPPLGFCQTLAQFGFVGNRDASILE